LTPTLHRLPLRKWAKRVISDVAFRQSLLSDWHCVPLRHPEAGSLKKGLTKMWPSPRFME
jgi:hypothetical protein